MPRRAKQLIVITLDSSLTLLATWLAFYLRLGEWIVIAGNQWIAIAVALLALPLFWAFGLYRAIFRYVGIEGLTIIGNACAIYALFYVTLFTFLGVTEVPRTIGFIQPILLFVLVCLSRVLAGRLLGLSMKRQGRRRVLIYGAGSSGRQLASALTRSSEMDVVGFVDDDNRLQGATLDGRPIKAPESLARFVARQGVSDILLAIPSATRRRRGQVVDMLRPLSVRVQTVPGLTDLASGKVQVSSLRNLEIEDLLGRDVAMPDEVLFSRLILGKAVLVTGAGGSIGSELCRQIVAAHPKALLLVESSEFALYAIDAELRSLVGDDNIKIVPMLASVRDEARMRAILSAWHPATIYHAAAYKHVPLVEHNPAEGVLNNVFGTMTTAQLAIEYSVSHFVLISTDKAVRPTNIMGTTKRLAEMCLQALAQGPHSTCFSMVRFGNVLGSSGSVVPLFRSQIAAGGPITITHPEVTRYFMTIPEAAQLVIQAGAMAEGGEVFVLDMGEPILIADLARKMIELSGLSVRDEENPDGDVEIDVVGLRPGEKLFEELLIGENPSPTGHPLIMKAVERYTPLVQLEVELTKVAEAIAANDAKALLVALRGVVPEFAPVSEIVDWLHIRCANGAK